MRTESRGRPEVVPGLPNYAATFRQISHRYLAFTSEMETKTMISLLLQFALVLMPLSALASDAKYQEPWRGLQASYVVATAGSACTKGCESEYFRCAKKSGGKDMKRCSDERKVCYRDCSSAASRSECPKGCDGAYFQCAKKNGKDMKQCSDERKVCYRRCSSS